MITSNLTCIWFIVRCIMWQLSHFCNLKMLLFFLCLRVSQPCIKSAHVSYFLDWKLFYKLHWNLFFLCIPSLQSLSPNSSVCLQWISSSEAAWRCVMANVFQPVSFGCILSPFLYLPNLLRPPPLFALNRDALYLHYPTELHYFSGHKMLLQFLHRSDRAKHGCILP